MEMQSGIGPGDPVANHGECRSSSVGENWHRILVLLAGLLFTGGGIADAAWFRGLEPLPQATWTSPLAVSANGQVVVGVGYWPGGGGAVRWTAPGGVVSLGDLWGQGGDATAVSADGSVIVGEAGSPTGRQAFRWTEFDGAVGLGDLPGGAVDSTARGVSADGSVVVGTSGSASGNEAFRWTQAEGMVGLGLLPGGGPSSSAMGGVSADGSVVVGAADSGSQVTCIPEIVVCIGGTSTSGYQAFRWTASEGMVGLGYLAGGSSYSAAQAVSADGRVIVGWSYSGFGREAFRWTASEGMVGLGDLPGGIFYSLAFGVSADGSVIVGQSYTASGYEAFIWDAGRGMRNLKDVLGTDYGLADALNGWTLEDARAISADGLTIVGRGVNPSGDPQGWVADLHQAILEVTIDIKPGSVPNTINLGSAGVVPVAILSSPTFDAQEVNPETVRLAGASVKLIGKGDRFSCAVEDVNGDGLPDLLCHIVTAQFALQPEDTVAVLEAETFSGQRLRGEDSIQIVP
jgi:probable HAF family extracellular repeat protein